MKIVRASIVAVLLAAIAALMPIPARAATVSVTMGITCQPPNAPNCTSANVGDTITFSGTLSGVANPAANNVYVDIEQDGAPIFMTYVDAGGNYSTNYVTTPADSGTHSYSAFYDASPRPGFDPGNQATSAPVSFTVAPGPPTTSVTMSITCQPPTPPPGCSSATVGQTITFSGTLSGVSNPAANNVYVDIEQDGSPIFTVNVDANGYYSANHVADAGNLGTHSYTAYYDASPRGPGFNPGSPATSAPVPFTVSPAPAPTSVTMSITCQPPNPPACSSATVGQTITFSGRLSGVSNPAANNIYVDIEQDGTPIFTTNVDSNGNYSANYVLTASNLGTHSYDAYYDASPRGPGFNPGAPARSTAVNFTVTPARTATTTTLYVSNTTPKAGQQDTLVAQVGGGNNPTGTMDFVIDGVDHYVPVTNYPGYGYGAYLTTSFAAGTHTVVAKYSGDSTNAPSQSNPATVTAQGKPCKNC